MGNNFLTTPPPRSILWSKSKSKNKINLKPFLDKKLPIFWIVGPRGVGKSTLAEMLARSSKYHLLSIESLLLEELQKGKRPRGTPDDNTVIPIGTVINILKETFVRTYASVTGYIIDGFPNSLKQAKTFEKRICKVNLIIYVTLVLDALLARKITQIGPFDPNEERIKYLNQVKHLNKIAKKYDQKTLKLHANYPPEKTCTKLVENLEDFWGYRFSRLYNRNE